MESEVKAGIDRTKANLDKLAQALDRIATDATIRERLGTKPIETLQELGFELDEKSRAEILEDLIVARTSEEEVVAFGGRISSAVKSGVKVGVTTATTTATKSATQAAADSLAVAIIAVEKPTPPEEKPGKKEK